MFKKLFSRETDEKVKAIRKESEDKLKEATIQSQSLNELMAENGVTMLIFVGTGGQNRMKKK